MRAMASCQSQTWLPRMVIGEMDAEFDDVRTGSAATRNRALTKVETEWVLWLDDDDQLMPHAVQLLVEAQRRTGADVVSGAAWIPQTTDHKEPTAPIVTGWIDPVNIQLCSVLTVTSLMRTELVRKVGGFEFRRDPLSGMDLDDYGLYYKLAEAGATFYRIPQHTFIWNVHGANTSGRPDRW